ncbi:MAG: aspartyl protease family protein [Chitinophagales bacterium]|nr:aspartyl protease family protein [Chitinophagales bacterium]
MKLQLLIVLLLTSFKAFSNETPIQLLPSGHIIVEANVNGKAGKFIFDTGGGINLFFDDFAKDFTPDSTYNFLTAYRATGEKITSPIYESTSIFFAGKEFKNIPYATFDMNIQGINGLISLEMFREQDFIIDYEQKRIILSEDLSTLKNKKSFDIQLTTNADKSLDISTYILLNNKYKIQTLLDSGAGNDSFWLNSKYIPILHLDSSKLDLVVKESEFNPNIKTKFYKGSVQSISNQYASVENPNVVFVEDLIYEGKTSINWLGKKIGISLKNKKIYILNED